MAIYKHGQWWTCCCRCPLGWSLMSKVIAQAASRADNARDGAAGGGGVAALLADHKHSHLRLNLVLRPPPWATRSNRHQLLHIVDDAAHAHPTWRHVSSHVMPAMYVRVCLCVCALPRGINTAIAINISISITIANAISWPVQLTGWHWASSRKGKTTV